MFKFRLKEYNYRIIEDKIAKKFGLGEPQSSGINPHFREDIVDEEIMIAGSEESRTFNISIIKDDRGYLIKVR